MTHMNRKTHRRPFLTGTIGTVGGIARFSGPAGEQKRDEQSDWKPTAHDVTAHDGHCLQVWERTFAEDPDEAVLFIHGATYHALSRFDPPVAEDFGWLNFVAERGQAAYAVDMCGYGESEPPAAYEQPPEENKPIARLSREVDDLIDILNFIQKKEGFDRVHCIGHSLGTWRVRALYNKYDPQFATVTLYAGSYQDIDIEGDPEDPAYGTETREEFLEDWNAAIPKEEDRDQWIGGDQFTADEVQETIWKTLFDSNQAAHDDPQTIFTPSIYMDEDRHPKHIIDPTLVIRGSNDTLITREGALNLYDAVGATNHRKQYTEIAGGTHALLNEAKRRQLFDTTYHFQTMY